MKGGEKEKDPKTNEWVSVAVVQIFGALDTVYSEMQTL